MYVKNRLSKVSAAARSKVAALVAVASAAALAAPAHAAAIDVSDVVTGIKEYTGTGSPIVLIGGAVLLVVLAVKAIGWVRSSMK